ncbi:MAG: hypothetical protein ACREV7_17275 [Steroidobacteraceae bacterium]
MVPNGRYMADKLTILSFLRARPELWLSLREPGVEGVPDRTLRNWLSDLVKESAIESRGERKGRRYRLRHGSITATGASMTAGWAQLTGTHEIFSAESLALIRRIEAPIYTRAPATYRENWLQSYVPNQSAYLTPKQREELAALGKRDPIYGRARTYIKRLYDRLLIDFSFNSARLEGNTYRAAGRRLRAVVPAKLPAVRRRARGPRRSTHRSRGCR